MKKHIRPFALLVLLSLPALLAAQVRSDFDRRMNEPAEPFRIIGNIHYVGSADLAVYLITTPDGHILIDGGFAETVPQIEENVKKLGFDLADVKILLVNHEHSDHAGGLKLLKEKTGARLYASPEAKKQLENGGTDDFAFGDDLTFDPVTVDSVLRDGQTVGLGGVRLKTHFTPGHTKGCTTFTTDLREGKRDLSVIFLCSTTALDYRLVENEKYPGIAKDFIETFARLRKLEPDVFLSSHASFFGMKKKFAALRDRPAANPFIDPAGYLDFLDRVEKQFAEKLDKQMKAYPVVTSDR